MTVRLLPALLPRETQLLASLGGAGAGESTHCTPAGYQRDQQDTITHFNRRTSFCTRVYSGFTPKTLTAARVRHQHARKIAPVVEKHSTQPERFLTEFPVELLPFSHTSHTHTSGPSRHRKSNELRKSLSCYFPPAARLLASSVPSRHLCVCVCEGGNKFSILSHTEGPFRSMVSRLQLHPSRPAQNSLY